MGKSDLLDQAVIRAYRRNHPNGWKKRMKEAVQTREIPPVMQKAILTSFDRIVRREAR